MMRRALSRVGCMPPPSQSLCNVRQPGRTAMKTLKDRDMWQSMVLADGHLSSGCKCTLVRISLHHNFKTGRCNPSYETLATGTAFTLAAIPKHLKQGEERGY